MPDAVLDCRDLKMMMMSSKSSWLVITTLIYLVFIVCGVLGFV
jgi:hypothetical protein